MTDSYAYDSVGRLAQLASSQAGTFSWSYDAAGRRSELRRPNGVVTSYSYDDADAVTAIVHAKAGVMIDQSRYGYDAAGRRTLVEQADGPRSYSYDAAGRVTGADNPAPLADEVFAYDELGNRTNQGEVVDAANRLQSRTGFTYAWDREGRLTARTNTQSGEVTRFSWSDDGRLRSVTLPSGGSVRYAYDPLGRRIATTSTGGVRRVQTYGLDPNAVAEQSGGDPQTRYTFGLGYDTPLAMTTSTASSSAVFFQQDALSSVTSLTNAAGAIVGRATYDTYGQITTQTGVVSPYTYTGREHDAATGLYHYRARWYDPASGRFTSEDPVPAANLYPYANGNPVGLTDPSGLMANLAEQDTVQAVLAQMARSTFRSGVFGAGFGGATGSIGYLLRCGGESRVDGLLKAAGDGAIKGGIIGLLSGGVYSARFVQNLVQKGAADYALVRVLSTFPAVAVGLAAAISTDVFVLNNQPVNAEYDVFWYLLDAATNFAKPLDEATGNVVDGVEGTASASAQAEDCNG